MKTEYKTHESQRKISLQNYYLKHDKYLQAAKDYYWAHREEKQEYYKQWKEKNYERVLARRREKYALTHPKKSKPEKSPKPEPKPEPKPPKPPQQIFYDPAEISQPFKEASFLVTWDQMDKLEKRRKYYASKKEHIRLKQYEWREKNSRPKKKGVPGIFKTKYPVYNYSEASFDVVFD